MGLADPKDCTIQLVTVIYQDKAYPSSYQTWRHAMLADIVPKSIVPNIQVQCRVAEQALTKEPGRFRNCILKRTLGD
jgi:hypothetical protein